MIFIKRMNQTEGLTMSFTAVTNHGRKIPVPSSTGRMFGEAQFATKGLRAAVAMGVAAAALMATCTAARASGTWTPVANFAPGGVNLMLLLSDGTVMAQNGGNSAWFKLTPDIHGSYVNGTWTTLASMHDTRLYGASQVMPDGNVFIAGAEYGTGGNTAEVYNPVTNTWRLTPNSGQHFSDCISTVLPNGKVIVGPVGPSVYGGTVVFDDATNSWTAGPTYFRGGYQDEASWVKMPDGSILTIDPFGTNSERLIPAANRLSQDRWIDDSIVPVSVYDNQGELGGAFLLPTGQAFYLGGTGHTALYTPSGTTAPGTWAAGPDIPDNHGSGDCPSAMMVNGSILCVFGKPSSFDGPTYFYEYNPYTNAFSQVNGPNGPTDDAVPYGTKMLDLPDGGVLYANGGGALYEYRPDGAQIASARPTVTGVAHNADGSYQLTGKLLTGISEGAAYGDDAQMATNYPIVRLTAANGNVYYARTFQWNDTGVMSTRNQTTQFTLPPALPAGNYSLQVVTNGIASDSIPFPTSEPYFMIVNQSALDALDLINSSTANGASIDQRTYNYNGPEQRWAFQPTENGDHFKLISFVSGKAAGIAGDSTSVGASLLASDYLPGDTSQQWDLDDAGSGWYNVRNVRSGLILELAKVGTATVPTVQQSATKGTTSQRWRLQPWGQYFLRASSGKYIGVQGGASASGSLIVQSTKANTPSFKWIFNSARDGYYGAFSMNATSRAISVQNASTAATAKCELRDYSVSNIGNQKLRIVPKTDGKFKFYFAHDAMSWDIPGGALGDNISLEQYPDNANPWQEFSLERTP